MGWQLCRGLRGSFHVESAAALSPEWVAGFSGIHRKWSDLQETGHYELLTFFSSVKKQYRISGGYAIASEAEARHRFELASELTKKLSHFYQTVGLSEMPLPDSWIDELDAQPTDFSDDYVLIRLEPNFADRLDVGGADGLYTRTHFALQDEVGWQKASSHRERLSQS